jgi:hypothetical protein
VRVVSESKFWRRIRAAALVGLPRNSNLFQWAGPQCTVVAHAPPFDAYARVPSLRRPMTRPRCKASVSQRRGPSCLQMTRPILPFPSAHRYVCWSKQGPLLYICSAQYGRGYRPNGWVVTAQCMQPRYERRRLRRTETKRANSVHLRLRSEQCRDDCART